MCAYYPLYSKITGEVVAEAQTDPPAQTIESLAVLATGEEMREALLLDILGEIRALYPHHYLEAKLTPMGEIGQPVTRHRLVSLRQGSLEIVERP